MSQHDYDIANAAGATIRADLNAVLLAIASNNSGATEPATTYAYQLWADTTSGYLKQRTGTNNAWVTLFKLSDASFKDSLFMITDAGDATKQLVFEASGIATGTTCTLTAPNWNGKLAAPSGDGSSGQVLTSGGAGVQPSWQTPELSGVPAGSMAAYAGIAAPSGWLFAYGQAVSRVTYSALFAAMVASATATMTIASPCVVTWTGHPLLANDPIKLTTTGALPTGLTAGTTYYVKYIDGNTFNLSATPGGANINTSGSQSGTHTAIHAPHGDGDGSTTFNVPDMRGRVPVGSDDLGGTAASRVTSAGSGINGNVPGASGGAETVSLTSAQNGSHTHSESGAGSAANYQTGKGGSGYVFTSTTTGSSGSGTAHQNMAPSLIAKYIIKT